MNKPKLLIPAIRGAKLILILRLSPFLPLRLTPQSLDSFLCLDRRLHLYQLLLLYHRQSQVAHMLLQLAGEEI
jgi:hypothetical protein